MEHIISFFSYKGGAGRTSLLLNTLPLIAKELNASAEEPIIVADLDIDSKGLSFLLDKKREPCAYNAIDVLKGRTGLEVNAFFDGLIPVGKRLGLHDDKAVLFITAHPQNDGNRYLGNGSNIDASNVSLRALEKKCSKRNCKALIIDTPSGNQLAGIAGLDISSHVVAVMRITGQFREGTEEFLTSVDTKYSGKRFVIVPNAVPDDTDTGYSVENMIRNISSSVKTILKKSNPVNTALLDDGNFGIPEVRQFKFKEMNLYAERELNGRTLRDDELAAMKGYELLAKELCYD
jgi:cellulose biosynthesis protein BcsQ